MCNQFSPGLPKKLESVKVNISSPVVGTDDLSGGRPRAVSVRSRDYQIFWDA